MSVFLGRSLEEDLSVGMKIGLCWGENKEPNVSHMEPGEACQDDLLLHEGTQRMEELWPDRKM